jgi:hypothetical protein
MFLLVPRQAPSCLETRSPGASPSASLLGSPPEAPQSPVATEVLPEASTAAVDAGAADGVTSSSEGEPDVPGDEGDLVENVQVPDALALARVNGTAITLKDLVPGRAVAGSSEVMTQQMFSFLLDNAIERELIFQASSKAGVKVTAEEEHRQELLRRTLLAREDQASGSGVPLNVGGTQEERIDFEMREAASQILLASLLAKEGVSPPHVTEDDVKQYRQDNPEEYSTLPSDSQPRDGALGKMDFEIRQKLSMQIQAEYENDVRQFLDDLKASARISVVAFAR